MAGVRVTQSALRVVRGGAPDARVTQSALRVVRGGAPSGRVSQVVIRVVRGLVYIPPPILGMYDFLPLAEADYDYTLSLDSEEMIISGGKSGVEIHRGRVTEERVILSEQSEFGVKLRWRNLEDSDHSLLFTLFNDTDQGMGAARTFYWQPPAQYDSHVYVVRFDCDWESFLQNYKNYGLASILLAVVGRKAE